MEIGEGRRGKEEWRLQSAEWGMGEYGLGENVTKGGTIPSPPIGLTEAGLPAEGRRLPAGNGRAFWFGIWGWFC